MIAMHKQPLNGRIFAIKRMEEDEYLFLHEIEKMHDPSAYVLDLGAGAGTFPYGKFQSRIFALDIDRSIRAHKSLAGRLALADAAALPFSGDVFDIVVANFVFEHFISPDVVLKEIQRTLKTGGLLYIAVPNSASWEDKLFRLLGGHKLHVQAYTFHSILKLIYQNTCFKLSSFADWPPGFTYLSSDPMGRPLRRFMLRLLRRLRPLMQRFTRKDSGYVLLLRNGRALGYRRVTHTCAYCGAGVTIDEPAPKKWQCLQCNQINRT